MHLDFLVEVFQQNADRDAMVWRDQVSTYRELLELYRAWQDRLEAKNVSPGQVVSVEADFSPNTIALFLALIERGCIIVPMTGGNPTRDAEQRETAEVELVIRIDSSDQATFTRTGQSATHAYYARLRELKHPGLVIFTSGSTGKRKAALHDFVPLLAKFKKPRKCGRMIVFYLFDHIGGIDTLFSWLSNAALAITLPDRAPDTVAASIAKYKIELLPASPTFLNLLLMSEAPARHDLSSLKLVTYGTEPMPASTLSRLRQTFPGVDFQQKYGLSELGILRSKSKSPDSPWVRLGGENVETRVVDGLLEVKAPTAMLGYLNAESPFTEDGWYKTGDMVETDGEFYRILGRKSELINVGGEKVFPAEVENVLLDMPGVLEAVVQGEANPITGNFVVATVRLNTGETRDAFKKRMRAFMQDRLQPYKIPQRVTISEGPLHGDRFKKQRTPGK
jgi:acyl-coenzyme A synthetase/AMP-(fatty) acid ligase